MKLKLIALAALLAVGSAQAAIDTGDTGNGSLVLNLKWKETPVVGANDSASATFDLGLSINDAATWNGVSGFTRSWNLSTGVMSGTGIAPTVIGSYGTTFNTFLSTSNLVLANAEMNVFAFDAAGTNPGDSRIFSTANQINATGTALSLTAAQTPSNSNFNNIFGSTTVSNFLSALNNSANHNTVANGASNATASSGSAYFDNGTGMDKFANLSLFDSTGKFSATYAAGAGMLSGQAQALPFYALASSSSDPFAKATMSAFGYDLNGNGAIEFDNNGAVAGGANEYGLWTLQGNTLTFSNPTVTAVPEAETYAMMLAGLGLMGAIIRRRKSV